MMEKKLKRNPGRCLKCCSVHRFSSCSMWWRTMVKPSLPGVCWSLHFLKNVGRDLATSVTFTRRAVPVGAQPPGSAAPEHRGQPKGPYIRFGFPSLTVFPRVVWSCSQQWGQQKAGGNGDCLSYQSIKGKLTSSPACGRTQMSTQPFMFAPTWLLLFLGSELFLET